MNSSPVFEQLKLLPEYLGGHMLLTLIALIAGIVICVPLGIVISRVKPLQWPVLTMAGILQTIPGIALLALMVPILGTIGFLPALLALTIYSFLPILRNTVTGIIEVDRSLVEAARGMGMTETQSLFRVELPLAMPILIAGIRTAAVWVVGTATLATPVGATSLGNYVFSGLQTQNITAIIVGCIAAATLAIILDQLIHLVELASIKRRMSLFITAILFLVALFTIGLYPVLANRINTNDQSKTVVIGSKPFSEQYILSQLINDKVTASGFTGDRRSGMGSIILFEALADGSIDCYVDYSGTIWTNVMKQTEIPNRDLMLDSMTVWLKKEFGITCLGRLGFENTYAMAMRTSESTKRGIGSITELSVFASNLKMGSDYEFFSRPEWESLKSEYKLEFEKLISMDPSLMYSAIEQGEVDVISAYSTDGRIAAYELTVLSDPNQALPPYDAVLLLSAQAAKDDELVNCLTELINGIDDDAMRQANKLVDVDKSSVDSASAMLFRLIRGQ